MKRLLILAAIAAILSGCASTLKRIEPYKKYTYGETNEVKQVEPGEVIYTDGEGMNFAYKTIEA